MAEIQAIAATDSNCDNNGGIKYSYGTDATNITAVTITSGAVSGFTMSSTGLWSKLEFDDDENTASFNQEGAKNGSSIEFTQDATFQFNGLNQAKVTAANNAKACCGTVFIHFTYEGTAFVQGIEVDPSNNWALTKDKARVIPSANTGTADENVIMIYNVNSTSRYAAPTTTLNEAAIEAL